MSTTRFARPVGLLIVWLVCGTQAPAETVPPLRAITRGPKFHWFAYYDKLQFDPSGRYVLGMESDFDDRDVRPDDVIRVGMVDDGTTSGRSCGRATRACSRPTPTGAKCASMRPTATKAGRCC